MFKTQNVLLLTVLYSKSGGNTVLWPDFNSKC